MKSIYFLTAFTSASLFCAEVTWTGATSNLMNTASNWSPASVPSNGDSLNFIPNPPALSLTNNIGTFTLGSNLFISDAYILGGSPFQISGSGTLLTYGSQNSNLTLAGMSGGLILDGGTLTILGGSGNNTITSVITGTGGLSLKGTVITLNGQNTYSGATQIGIDGAGSTLIATASGNLSPNSNITVFTGSTLKMIGGLNTIGTLTGSGAVDLGTGTLTITNSGTNTFSGNITGTNGGLALSGGGSLTLSGSNSYSTAAQPGSTRVNAGTLVAGTINAFGNNTTVGSSGALTIAEGATVDLSQVAGANTFFLLSLNGNDATHGGTLTLGNNSINVSAGGSFAGVIQGGGGLIVSGGSLTLTGTNLYSGATNIQAGTLTINGATALGSTSGLTFSISNGTLKLSDNVTFSAPVTMSSSGTFDIDTHDLVLDDAITGSNSITFKGTGTVSLNGANSGFNGSVSVLGSTLEAGSSTAFGNNSAYSLLNSAALSLNGNSVSIGSVSGDASTAIHLGSDTLTITNGSIDDAFFGEMDGADGNLVITGGTVTLMTPKTYTGTTTINNAATLNVYELGDTSEVIFGSGSGILNFGNDATFANPITMEGAATISANTYEITLSGTITGGSEPLTKLGPGTFIVTGSMDASAPGQITLSGGTYSATAVGLGTGAGTPPPIVFVAPLSGSVLQLREDMTIPQAITLSAFNSTIDTNGNTVTISGAISGSQNFIKTGTGTLTLGGACSYSGKTEIYAGTLSVSSSNFSAHTQQLVFGGTGGTPTFQAGSTFANFTPSVVLMNNGTINTNGNNMTISGVVAGLNTFSLTKTGSGILALSGANIYTGPTIVTTGTLRAGVATVGTTSGAFGVGSAMTIGESGTVDLNGFANTINSLQGSGTLTSGSANGTLTINNGNSLTFSGNITSNAGITLTTGSLTLSGTNSYSGATTINGGSLIAGGSSAFSNNSAYTIASGGTLNLNNNNNTIGSLAGSSGSAVDLGSATLTIANGSSSNFGGAISGSGGLTLTTGTQILSGPNAYSGTTTISGGTLQAGSTSSLSVSSAVSIANGATLSLISFNNAIKSLTGASGSTLNLGSALLTIANGSGNTFSGNITGSGGINLTTGNLTFSGTNNYSGATIINGGATLTAGSTQAFGTSAISIASGGTVAFGTQGNTVGSITNGGTVTTTTQQNMASYTQTGILSLNLTNTPTPSDPTTFGNIRGTGTIQLGGTLTIPATTYAPEDATTLILVKSTATTQKGLKGSFSSISIPEGFKLNYDYAHGEAYLIAGGSSTCHGTWTSHTGGNWGDASNWGNDCAPGITNTASNLDTATFGNISSDVATIHLAITDSGIPDAQSVTLLSLSLNSNTTQYTISTFNDSAITLSNGGSDPDNQSPIPYISVSAGTHTINAPITLHQTCAISVTGQLTLGSNTTIDHDSYNDLYSLVVSEGTGSGGLINYGTMTPANIEVIGTTVTNHLTIQPQGGIAVIGLTGNADSTIINNYGTMSSGSEGNTSFTGINATTTINNYGTISLASNTDFLITAATLNNFSGATAGAPNADLILDSGVIATSGSLLANNYTQQNTYSTSVLQININNPTNSGKLIITNQGTFSGTLTVNALPGFSSSTPQTFTLITATNGFTSQFGMTTFNLPSSVIPEISILPNAIQLTTTPVAHQHPKSSTLISLSSIGMHNSLITRKCSQLKGRMEKPPASPQPPIALLASNEDLSQALGQINPEASEKTVQLAQRLKGASESPGNIYIGPIASFGHIDSQGDQIGVGYTSAGVLFGCDYAFNQWEEAPCHLGIGSMVEYRHGWGQMLQNSGSFSSDRIHVSLYTAMVPANVPPLLSEVILGFAHSWDHLNRKTGSLNDRQAIGHPNENILDALAGVEYGFNLSDHFLLTPLFHVQYAIDWVSSYQEKGAGIYNLKVDSHALQSLLSSLGTRLNYQQNVGSFVFRYELVAEWLHEFMNKSQFVYFTPFNITSTSTKIPLANAPRNGLLVAFDFLANLPKSWSLEANVTYQWNPVFYDTFFYLGIGKRF